MIFDMIFDMSVSKVTRIGSNPRKKESRDQSEPDMINLNGLLRLRIQSVQPHTP